jgi:hypothetical protein
MNLPNHSPEAIVREYMDELNQRTKALSPADRTEVWDRLASELDDVIAANAELEIDDTEDVDEGEDEGEDDEPAISRV